MRLELSEAEADLLAKLLETRRSNLLIEVRHTWASDYKLRLKQEEAIIERILGELKPVEQEVPVGH